MKNVRKIIAIIITLITISIYTYSFADVGSFDRYDSSSSWDSGSSWSSSSSDWGSSSSSWDWDDDYSSDGDLGFLIGLLLGNHGGRAVLIVIIIFIIIYSKKYKGTGTHRIPRNIPNPNNVVSTNNINKNRSMEVAVQVMDVDKNFSEEKFISFTKELFVKLQNAWTARDWEPMRPFETPELFEQHKAQIQGYIDTNRINVMDRIAVDYAHLYKFRIEGEKEILEVGLRSTMKDYIIDATTKQVLEGNKTEDRRSVYKLTFERTKGAQTPEETDEIKTTNCPNCGAPTKITSAGRCEYCDSIIVIGDHGWALSNLEPFTN